jgi:hypothetical protein
VLVLASVVASRTGPPLSVDGVGGPLLLLEHAASNARIHVKDTLFVLIMFAPSIE